MLDRITIIKNQLLAKLNGSDCCILTFKKSGEQALLKYQGNDAFYAGRNENWYLGQPEKCRHWVTTATLEEMAEWIDKYC